MSLEQSSLKRKRNSGGRIGETTQDCPLKKQKSVPITSVTLVSVEFRSDHAVLTDHVADWGNGGNRYPKPEWTAGAAHPVTHTKNTAVTVRLTLAVLPANADPVTGTIRGTIAGQPWFADLNVAAQGGNVVVDLTSIVNLPNIVRDFDFRVTWVINFPPRRRQKTTANLMYITMAAPQTPPNRPGITRKRMDKAVELVSGANSNDPHVIVEHIFHHWGTYNLAIALANAWELADHMVAGADCQSICRFVDKVIQMVGCPGVAERVFVWATVGQPGVPQITDPTNSEAALAVSAYHDRPSTAHPAQWHAINATWSASLIDLDGGRNCYEACLRFTHGGQTRYYAGGVGRKDTALEVLQVFFALCWIDNATPALTIMGIIHQYRDVRQGDPIDGHLSVLVQGQVNYV